MCQPTKPVKSREEVIYQTFISTTSCLYLLPFHLYADEGRSHTERPVETVAYNVRIAVRKQKEEYGEVLEGVTADSGY